MKLPSGTVLKQQYKIESCLGEGGFGITYKCIDIKTSKVFAIKEMWSDSNIRQGNNVVWNRINRKQLKEQIEQFKQEAFYLSRCIHPNVVRVYEWFEENNTAYTVMGFLPSIPLSDILNDYLQENRPLPQQQVVRYFRQIAAALQIVHNKNLLHRDIKPQNILIDQINDRAILIDFGATRQFVADKTQTHDLILTPGYAPIEQYGNKERRNAATDIYALSATMYNLLTGRVPSTAVDRISSLMTTQQDILLPINTFFPDVNKYLESIIHSGLNVLLKDRFQEAKEIIILLNKLDRHQQARLIYLKSGDEIKEFLFDRTHNIIGKSEDNKRPITIDLDGFADSNTISRNHAIITRHQKYWQIKDLNSQNGTFIKPYGENKFSSRINSPQVLECGDEVAFGKVRFLFQTF